MQSRLPKRQQRQQMYPFWFLSRDLSNIRDSCKTIRQRRKNSWLFHCLSEIMLPSTGREKVLRQRITWESFCLDFCLDMDYSNSITGWLWVGAVEGNWVHMKLAKQRQELCWDIMRLSALCACDSVQYKDPSHVRYWRPLLQCAALKTGLRQNVIINININLKYYTYFGLEVCGWILSSSLLFVLCNLMLSIDVYAVIWSSVRVIKSKKDWRCADVCPVTIW